MNRNVHTQVGLINETGVTIRQPSTAYLTINTDDAYYNTSGINGKPNGAYYANNFLIQRFNQLISGQFTRMGVAEVKLDWGIPNITSAIAPQYFEADANGNPIPLRNTGIDPTRVSMALSPLISGYTIDGDGNVFFNSVQVGLSGENIPVILVNGINTPIVASQLPLLDPAGAPIDISGSALVGETFDFQVPNNFYNVYELLNQFIVSINANVSINSTVYSLVTDAIVGVRILCKVNGIPQNFGINPCVFWTSLGFARYCSATVTQNNIAPFAPNLMVASYVDICSPELTQIQQVKDTSTNTNPKDLLYRWNFGDIAPSPRADAYGFPILQGYEPFVQVRQIPFPKQIRWDPLLAVGNVSFQSFLGVPRTGFYDYVPILKYPNIVLVPATPYYSEGFKFTMNLLLSED